MAGRKQALVMSINGRRMVVMQADGSWRNVPVMSDASVGDMVFLPAHIGINWRLGSLVAAMMVVALLTTSMFILPAGRAMACISVDGIPGVELTTNAAGRVLSGEAVTPEGELLLVGLELKGQNLSNAVQQLLRRASASEELVVTADVVLMTVTPTERQLSERVLHRLSEQVKSGVIAAFLPGSAEPQVEQLLVPKSLQAEAKALGLPSGQYALMLQASEVGVSIDLEQVSGKNVVKELQSQGLNPGQLIKQLQQGEDLDRLMNENRDKVPGKLKKETGEQQPTEGDAVGQPTDQQPDSVGGNKGKDKVKDNGQGK